MRPEKGPKAKARQGKALQMVPAVAQNAGLPGPSMEVSYTP